MDNITHYKTKKVNMKTVKLIKDYDVESWLFKDTILTDCILADHYYIGMFKSKLGNFVVNVPEIYCVEIEHD